MTARLTDRLTDERSWLLTESPHCSRAVDGRLGDIYVGRMGMLSICIGAMLTIACLEFYLTRPRCPECNSIRATVNKSDGRIRLCRQCLNIYIVRR